MKNILITSVCLLLGMSLFGQTKFRSGIFLHHSTGLCIWGPNGSSTSIPQEMTAYNTVHSYTGQDAVTMNEEWWSPSDNEWSTQHDFFEDPSLVTGIGYYLPGNKIVVIKSCFPSSAMSGFGQASDTLSPTDKTIYNYKWHWRHIVNVMKTHPSNFFVLWTNAPLEINSTNLTEAGYSNLFCKWAKDTLAQGLDPLFGAFPPNVYVFDFFHKITDATGVMLPQYAVGSGDSHPNAAATTLVAPQFVQEIFDAAINYESIYSQINESKSSLSHFNIYPNPASDFIVIHGSSNENDCKIYDLHGKLVLEQKNNGSKFQIDVSLLTSGLYYLKLTNRAEVEVIKIVIENK